MIARAFKKVICRAAIPIILVWVLYLPSCGILSSIKVIYSYEDVDFDAITPDTLVVFDVDETLIQPEDMYLIHTEMLDTQGKRFHAKMLQKYPHVKDWLRLHSIVTQQSPRRLIEPDVIRLIKWLQGRGVLVIACTAMNTGAYGVLPTMEQWRYEHLKSLGFEGSYSDFTFSFNAGDKHPVFYKGILATDGGPKGPALGMLLDALQLTFKKIIMFDDNIEYLRTVQKECSIRGITFKGYQYKNTVTKPWDEALAEFQADYLIRNEQWLNDEQALAMMREAAGKEAAQLPVSEGIN